MRITVIKNTISYTAYLALFVFIVTTKLAFAEKAYVSDQLSVPIRSGASDAHRIVNFLKSGIVLNVIDTEGEYSEIKLKSGKTAWLLTKDIMSKPSTREQLVSANQKVKSSKSQVKNLNNSVAKLKEELRALKGERSALQNKSTNLSNSLEDLKVTAANPIALSKKNKQLKKALEKARANEKMLQVDNQQLSSSITQEWFLIGGAVSLGSLVLGILLTRINWRRKSNSWGGSF